MLKLGKKYSLTHRKVLATNNKTAKKAEKIAGTDAESTMMMGLVIYNYRKSLKHKGISLIKAGSPQYTILKDITKNAIEFYNDFQEHFTSVKDAAVKYITIATSLITTFTLNRIPSLHEKITATFQAQLDIKEDPNLELTERAYKAYVRRVIEMTGTLLDDPKKNPMGMVAFTKVSAKCKELRVTPEMYIEAQFFGLEFCQGIPQLSQLTGDKSLGYLQRYRMQVGANEPEKVTDKKTINRFKQIVSS